MAKDTKTLIEDFIAKHEIQGNAYEVGHTSDLHPGGRCYRVTFYRPGGEGAAECWVYEGQMTYELSLASALWQISDNAEMGEFEPYQRWLAEGGSDYQHELGEETAKLFYAEQREHYLQMERVLGSDLMIELNDLIRNGEYREREKEKKNVL